MLLSTYSGPPLVLWLHSFSKGELSRRESRGTEVHNSSTRTMRSSYSGLWSFLMLPPRLRGPDDPRKALLFPNGLDLSFSPTYPHVD
jgi:hypothetical protein